MACRSSRSRCTIPLAVTAALFLLGSMSLGQTDTRSRWDADGGFSGDYRGIARLRWAGPGEPDSFEEYRRRRGNRPFQSEPLYSIGGKARAQRVLVLVNTGLQPSIQTELDTYVADLVQDGYTVDLHQASGGTAQNLKSFILANSTDLFGCVFIGEQPTAWFEHTYWGYESFPCDLYLMDLDGDWSDTDTDGKYDQHAAGAGDVGPEVFVGRIDASMMSGDEGAITRAYLDKNHLYRTGSFVPPRHALTYTEDDWAGMGDMMHSVHYAYSSYEAIDAPDTSRDDYIQNRLPDPGYELIQLACHSSPSVHAFTRGGYAYSSAVQNAPPESVFYNLFCCSSLRFTSSNYIGGSYIYDTGSPGLSVIGSTKTGSMLVFSAFYNALDEEVFGEAFRRWFNTIAPYNQSEIAWHYGMTVAGDPMLGIGREFLTIDEVTVLGNTGDESTPRTVEADIVAGFDPPVTGPELRYRAGGSGSYTGVPMTWVGGDTYTAEIPAFLSPIEVEYYVRAEDAIGREKTFPVDAPDEVLSYVVGLPTTYFHDSFETPSGWTHGSDAGLDDWQCSSEEGLDGTAGEAGDPIHAADGTCVWGTDLGAGSWDGYHADSCDSWLLSPVFDLSEATAATLRFERWLTVDSSGGDVARILVNGQVLWQSPGDADVVDTFWREIELDLSSFDGEASVQLEFRLTTDATGALGGWNVDAVRVTGIAPSDSCRTAIYCAAKTNSQGIVPAIGSTGTPTWLEGDFEVTLTGGIPGQAALYLWGSGPHDHPFQGGTLCVKPPQTRSTVQMIDGTTSASWPIQVTPPMAGTTRYYQVWFRDPGDPTTGGLSDGLEVRFCDW